MFGGMFRRAVEAVFALCYRALEISDRKIS